MLLPLGLWEERGGQWGALLIVFFVAVLLLAVDSVATQVCLGVWGGSAHRLWRWGRGVFTHTSTPGYHDYRWLNALHDRRARCSRLSCAAPAVPSVQHPWIRATGRACCCRCLAAQLEHPWKLIPMQAYLDSTMRDCQSKT